MIIDAGSISNNVLRDDILMITACSVRCDRQALSILAVSESYARKTLKGLKDKKYIRVNRKDGLLSLGKAGLDFLQETSPQLYEYFMSVSNNNHPGSDIRHKELFRKTSLVLAAMRMADVLIGPEKPTYEEITSDPQKKLSVWDSGPAFFLNKELKSAGQKQGREQISRSVGILLSDCLCAVTYNALDKGLRFNRMAEKQAHARIIGAAKTLYKDIALTSPTHSIVFCKSDEAALDIFNTVSPDKKSMTNCLGDVVRDKSIWGTDVLYVPSDARAKGCIERLVNFGPDRIVRTCFTENEMGASKKNGEGDAIVEIKTQKGILSLVCFEFCSGNITKLQRALRLKESGRYVGVVCFEWQVSFVEKVFEKQRGLRVRAIKEEKFNVALERREVVGPQIT